MSEPILENSFLTCCSICAFHLNVFSTCIPRCLDLVACGMLSLPIFILMSLHLAKLCCDPTRTMYILVDLGLICLIQNSSAAYLNHCLWLFP